MYGDVKHIETYRDLVKPTDEERMASWASKYFSGGYNRANTYSTAEFYSKTACDEGDDDGLAGLERDQG